MRGMNQSLFESVHGESSESDKSRNSMISDEAGTRAGGSSQGQSSLKVFMANMGGASIFEEAIALLIQKEVHYISQQKVSYPLETSASKRFLSKLVSMVQNTQTERAGLPKLASYTSSLFKIIIQEKNLNLS